MVATDFPLAISLEDSFSQTEAPEIVEEFVCGVCHGPLRIVLPPAELRCLIVCPEHGNVCDCGRVTNATVSIEIENSIKNYYRAVVALKDLWPELLERGFSRDHAFGFAKSYVCAVCGNGLRVEAKAMSQDSYIVVCPSHGHVDICGHIKYADYVYDFQKIRKFEKEHRR